MLSVVGIQVALISTLLNTQQSPGVEHLCLQCAPTATSSRSVNMLLLLCVHLLSCAWWWSSWWRWSCAVVLSRWWCFTLGITSFKLRCVFLWPPPPPQRTSTHTNVGAGSSVCVCVVLSSGRNYSQHPEQHCEFVPYPADGKNLHCLSWAAHKVG